MIKTKTMTKTKTKTMTKTKTKTDKTLVHKYTLLCRLAKYSHLNSHYVNRKLRSLSSSSLANTVTNTLKILIDH